MRGGEWLGENCDWVRIPHTWEYYTRQNSMRTRLILDITWVQTRSQNTRLNLTANNSRSYWLISRDTSKKFGLKGETNDAGIGRNFDYRRCFIRDRFERETSSGHRRIRGYWR